MPRNVRRRLFYNRFCDRKNGIVIDLAVPLCVVDVICGLDMRKFREKYIGNKDFYKTVLLVAIPIMIQNAITNFVSLLDNIMVRCV